MIPLVVEGRRELVVNSISKEITFSERHFNTPVVNVMLEPTDSSTNTNVTVVSVSDTTLGLEFSAFFDGFVHIHAVSAQ